MTLKKLNRIFIYFLKALILVKICFLALLASNQRL